MEVEAVHVMQAINRAKYRKFLSLFLFSHQEGQLRTLNCLLLLSTSMPSFVDCVVIEQSYIT